MTRHIVWARHKQTGDQHIQDVAEWPHRSTPADKDRYTSWLKEWTATWTNRFPDSPWRYSLEIDEVSEERA